MNEKKEPPQAGLMRRLAALSYDALLILSLLMLVTLVIIAMRGGEPVAPNNLLYQLALVTTMAAFGIVAVLEQEDETALEISSYRGLASRSPVLAAVFALALLSLAGFPPTAGFFGKFFVFSAAVDEGYIWLVVLAVLNSLISVYYYLRPVVAMYMHPAKDETRVALPATMTPVMILLVLVVLGLGIFPMLLVTSSAVAADTLF